MTKQETYEVGLKLLGVYILVKALSIVALTVINLAKLSFESHLFSTALYSLLHPAIQLGFGVFLVKKTKLIVSKLDK
ncbi:hypothetical protein PDESU_00437 [Pontiella desulfatans]|uniref:Uncharacterized protein n=1 Tax=Pontiella desulfatans TaxID=2750659 RepID=A0A6C2TW97_PONDE|nr:hypothetical protein [Pontiella desulfatans]VGO11889.1 hypothetical protein PDESU_00437 [Pontiella desulfatans]